VEVPARGSENDYVSWFQISHKKSPLLSFTVLHPFEQSLQRDIYIVNYGRTLSI
jgi:hypothetical protein